MPFVKDMASAMQALKNACNKNDDWIECWGCPFKKYCDVLEQNGLKIPGEWGKEEEEE